LFAELMVSTTLTGVVFRVAPEGVLDTGVPMMSEGEWIVCMEYCWPEGGWLENCWSLGNKLGLLP